MRSRVPSSVTYALRAAMAIARSRVGASAARTSMPFAQVAVDRGGADREAVGVVGVGLALAQMSDFAQRLAVNGQAPPVRPQLRAWLSQRVGQHDQLPVGRGHPRRVGRHPKLLAGELISAITRLSGFHSCL